MTKHLIQPGVLTSSAWMSSSCRCEAARNSWNLSQHPFTFFVVQILILEMMWAECSCEGSLDLEDEEQQGWARIDLNAKPLVI